MHQEWTGPGECAALADRRCRWLPCAYRAKSSPENGGPLEFLIPASSDDYLDFSHWYLYPKCRVLRPMACPSRPWKRCFPGCRRFRCAHESAVPLPLHTRGLGGEWRPSGYEWRHLPLQGLPDYAAQLWMLCQGDLVKAPGRLVDGRRWKVRCSGKRQPEQSAGDDCQQPPLWLQGPTALGHAVATGTRAVQCECTVDAVT